MKVKVIKAFKDKTTKSILKPGQVIEVSEERFSELTGPLGMFVEEIKEEPPEDKELTEPPAGLTDEVPNFEKMNKAEIVEYAKGISIELNMELTKKEMVEILLKK